MKDFKNKKKNQMILNLIRNQRELSIENRAFILSDRGRCFFSSRVYFFFCLPAV